MYFSNPNNSSSYPIDFKIVIACRFSGEAAPELTDIFPVQVWKQAYTGNETSLAEIEKKEPPNTTMYFEVRKHSGDFVMWSSSNSRILRCQADSGYIFDVEMSNGGGRRYFRNMRLMPYRERPYEPSNLNAITGQSVANGIYPSVTSNIKGDSTNQTLRRPISMCISAKPMMANRVAIPFHLCSSINISSLSTLPNLH